MERIAVGFLLIWMVCGCGLSHEVKGFSPANGADSAMSEAAADASTMLDAAKALDGSVVPHEPSCEPMDVTAASCNSPCDDGGPAVYWDGVRCREAPFLDMCTCQGADGGRGDCGKTWRTLEDCEAEQFRCSPSICRETGGNWGTGCFRSVCGQDHDPGVQCYAPHALCVCPIRHTWEEGRGCVEDEGCTPDDDCRATGGDLTETNCACPDGYAFGGAGLGCVPIVEKCDLPDECVDHERNQKCVVTGGRIVRSPSLERLDQITACGQGSDKEPIEPVDWYCQCPEGEMFDAEYGCKADDECLVRRAGHEGCGETLADGLSVTCASDAVCENGFCQPAVCGDDGNLEPGCGALPVDRRATNPSQCKAVQIPIGCGVWTTGIRNDQQDVVDAYLERCPNTYDGDCALPPHEGQLFDDGSFGDVMELVIEDGRCMTRRPR